MKLNLKSILVLALPILLALSASYYLQGYILTHQEEFTRWLANFGPFIILVYVLLQFTAVVFAPLGGSFLLIAMIALFGPEVAITLAYFVATPAYLVNFYLGRRYGRPLVEKVIGKTALEKMDHYIQDAGLTMLIILRLLQSGSFDYLSYGFGLTKIPFKTFIIVNFLAGIPGLLVAYFVITRFESLTSGILVLYTVAIIFSGLAIYISHRLKKHSKKQIK